MTNLFIVLVRTEYSRNLGASARAAANMGAHRLILVDPQCEIDDFAREGAAGAQKQLRECTVYPSWEEFYRCEGEGLRIALSRRPGKRRKIDSLKDVVDSLSAVGGSLRPNDKLRSEQNVYLIFGPEADGLNSEDLAWTNRTCYLPIHGDFKSLNLAHAVLLACYIFREKFPVDLFSPGQQESVCTRKTPVFFPERTIKQWITAMGFDIQKRRASAFMTLRRLLLQNSPTNQELHVLESILQQSIRKMTKADPP